MNPSGGLQLQEELASLQSKVAEMSTLVENRLGQAVEALVDRDVARAQEVIQGDREIDDFELELDEACINVLALQQPVARDLRLITMTMRIANDLERIGDHAVNIAEAVQHLEATPVWAPIRELDAMARIARQMLSDALDSFVRGDASAARDVRHRDDQVDAMRDSLIRILLTHMMEDPRRIGAAVTLVLTSRNIERVADLATNIAEDVVFLAEGRSIKHEDERVADQAKSNSPNET